MLWVASMQQWIDELLIDVSLLFIQTSIISVCTIIILGHDQVLYVASLQLTSMLLSSSMTTLYHGNLCKGKH